MTDILIEIGKYLGIVLVGVVLYLLERGRKWWTARRRNKRIGAWFNNSANAYREIREMLIELRTKLDSSRVLLIQYHNGQSFLPNTPIWRMSCMAETCAPGTSDSLKHIQNIPVAQWIGEIHEFMEKNIVYSTKDCPLELCQGEDREQCVRYYSVRHLPEGPWKTSLLLRGVQGIGRVSVITQGQVIGVLEANWMSDQYMAETVVPEGLCEMCQYAVNIGHLIGGIGNTTL